MVRALVLFLCLTLPVQAEPADPAALAQALPKPMLEKLLDRPDFFLEEASTLILGFGLHGGITPEGVETAIQRRRAQTSAREIRRLLLADLNGDGIIGQAEVVKLLPVENAGRRARLVLAHRAADIDVDGQVDWAELIAYGKAKAYEDFSPADAGALRGFMKLELDGDGRVQLDEVIAIAESLEGEA